MPTGPKPALGRPNTLAAHSTALGRPTLIGTAKIILQSKSGLSRTFRALIDPGSEGSFVTEEVVQALSLHKTACETTVTGVGGHTTATSRSTTVVALKSPLDPALFVTFSAVVLSRLSSLLPPQAVCCEPLEHLRGLELADPGYATPGAVDCILGADLYPVLIQEGLRRGSPTMPIAQQTKLGWILTGPAAPRSSAAPTTLQACHTQLSISDQLRRFWEIEEVAMPPVLTKEEEECELIFQRTHSRDSQGRYVVRLPFKAGPTLHNARTMAVSRLLALERKLTRDPPLGQAYRQFLLDYEELGHMERLPDDAAGSASYYLPHHAVVGRKLRVVFDAQELNQILLVGPKLQREITTILIRWRLFRYVFTADIVKMFRQIQMHADDAAWQCILWRATPELPIQEYRLRTVTYGTSCAPYLALRVLLQLAEDEGPTFPRGAQILRSNFYVDDALTGADTLDAAQLAKDELRQILLRAGMTLDKWSANDPALLEDVESAAPSPVRSFDGDDVVSTLGLRWSPHLDAFLYQVQCPSHTTAITKRTILGEIARLYDPLGLLAPVTVRAKILLQALWITGKDWDTPVDVETRRHWEDFRQQLPLLEHLRVPRWFGTTSSSTVQIHGFSDASEKAYAAAVYIVVLDAQGVRRSTLVTAKSKVAPLKAVSLPRLELCGALLLARLLVKTQADLDDYQAPVYCWSDSQVVLAWLRGSPSSWKVFVANRVSEIQTSLPAARWGHVRSAQNPADHATRGLTPTQLQENQLWWSGPGQIFDEAMESQEAHAYDTTLEKRATTATFYAAVSEEGVETLLTRFSSMRRAVRVLSFVRRWKVNYRLPAAQRPTRMIKAEELDSTRRHLIAAVQAHHFQKELALQRQGKPVHRTSSLRRLLPFLDPAGLLRVGGRLHYSFLGTDEKHPVIIPRNSHLAELLIRDAHRATLHGGPQLLQSHLCRTYWIPQARNKIRLLCRQCVQCCRFRGRTIEQQMAPLPSKRITPARPFSITGVDYAGPFAIRTSKGRGQRSYKGYVAIFTCFVTRAVHIEVVSDYTSKTFIAAFKRFVARRGLCREVVSDNGTTFQGADSELRSLFQQTSSFSQEVAEAIQADGISWSYIPPRAPHFGGLWEAAVKSFKHHLKRVLGDATLTFEEFSTLTACIEACLNSRPLSPLSADPGDIAALTPGHFLTGAALTAPPEPSSDLNVIGLPRWKLVTQMHQHFWARWHKEVLHHLQQRSKWLKQDRRPAVGDLVLLTDDQLPPLKWPLARIEALHPGADGLPRVATLRTATSTLKRPLVKVVPLPINEVASAHHAALSAAST